MPEEQTTITLQDGIVSHLCIIREKPTQYNVHQMSSRHSFGATDVDYWIKDTLLDMIASAKKKIFLATFLMVYPEVEQALMEASKRLRGHVYVLTPLDNSVYKDPRRQDELTPEELALAMEQQEERITALSQADVYIREHRKCHAKFCVVDKERALFMSSNLTERSMEENPELGKLIEDRSDVQALDQLFQQMWVHGADYELVPSKVRPDSKSIPHRQDRDDSLPFEPEHSLTWTYREQHHLLHAIIQVISSAKSSLKIGSYVLRELHHEEGTEQSNPLLQAFQDALSRGVQIEIVIHVRHDALGISQNENETRTYQQLFSHANRDNFRLYGHQKIHAKYVIADDISSLIFTANLDGRYGLTNGIEVGYLLNDPDDISWLCKYHTKLVDEAHRIFVCEPLLSELKHMDEIQMLSVRNVHVHRKTHQASLQFQNQVTEVLNHHTLAWTRVPDQPQTITVWQWPHGNQGVTLTQNLNDRGSWKINAIQNFGTRQRKDPQGFLLPGKVSVVSSWPYSTNEIKQKLNERVQEELKNQSAIPFSTITANWIGLSMFDLPFSDTSKEWLSKCRNYLLDATLEKRGEHWWIRPPVQDTEIMSVVKGHNMDGTIDIDAVMKDFEDRGWTIAGITTGTKVFRKYYEDQTGLKVRKDGTIGSDEKGS